MTWVGLFLIQDQTVVTLNCVLEMITEDFPKAMMKANFTSSTTSVVKPTADTVDLTIDSDEDEDVSKKTALTASPTKVKSNGM